MSDSFFDKALEAAGYVFDTPGALGRGLLTGHPFERRSVEEFARDTGISDNLSPMGAFGLSLATDPLMMLPLGGLVAKGVKGAVGLGQAARAGMTAAEAANAVSKAAKAATSMHTLSLASPVIGGYMMAKDAQDQSEGKEASPLMSKIGLGISLAPLGVGAVMGAGKIFKKSPRWGKVITDTLRKGDPLEQIKDAGSAEAITRKMHNDIARLNGTYTPDPTDAFIEPKSARQARELVSDGAPWATDTSGQNLDAIADLAKQLAIKPQFIVKSPDSLGGVWRDNPVVINLNEGLLTGNHDIPSYELPATLMHEFVHSAGKRSPETWNALADAIGTKLRSKMSREYLNDYSRSIDTPVKSMILSNPQWTEQELLDAMRAAGYEDPHYAMPIGGETSRMAHEAGLRYMSKLATRGEEGIAELIGNAFGERPELVNDISRHGSLLPGAQTELSQRRLAKGIQPHQSLGDIAKEVIDQINNGSAVPVKDKLSAAQALAEILKNPYARSVVAPALGVGMMASDDNKDADGFPWKKVVGGLLLASAAAPMMAYLARGKGGKAAVGVGGPHEFTMATKEGVPTQVYTHKQAMDAFGDYIMRASKEALRPWKNAHDIDERLSVLHTLALNFLTDESNTVRRIQTPQQLAKHLDIPLSSAEQNFDAIVRKGMLPQEYIARRLPNRISYITKDLFGKRGEFERMKAAGKLDWIIRPETEGVPLPENERPKLMEKGVGEEIANATSEHPEYISQGEPEEMNVREVPARLTTSVPMPDLTYTIKTSGGQAGEWRPDALARLRGKPEGWMEPRQITLPQPPVEFSPQLTMAEYQKMAEAVDPSHQQMLSMKAIEDPMQDPQVFRNYAMYALDPLMPVRNDFEASHKVSLLNVAKALMDNPNDAYGAAQQLNIRRAVMDRYIQELRTMLPKISSPAIMRYVEHALGDVQVPANMPRGFAQSTIYGTITRSDKMSKARRANISTALGTLHDMGGMPYDPSDIMTELKTLKDKGVRPYASQTEQQLEKYQKAITSSIDDLKRFSERIEDPAHRSYVKSLIGTGLENKYIPRRNFNSGFVPDVYADMGSPVRQVSPQEPVSLRSENVAQALGLNPIPVSETQVPLDALFSSHAAPPAAAIPVLPNAVEPPRPIGRSPLAAMVKQARGETPEESLLRSLQDLRESRAPVTEEYVPEWNQQPLSPRPTVTPPAEQAEFLPSYAINPSAATAAISGEPYLLPKQDPLEFVLQSPAFMRWLEGRSMGDITSDRMAYLRQATDDPAYKSAMLMLMSGMKRTDIAERLGVSTKTVSRAINKVAESVGDYEHLLPSKIERKYMTPKQKEAMQAAIKAKDAEYLAQLKRYTKSMTRNMNSYGKWIMRPWPPENMKWLQSAVPAAGAIGLGNLYNLLTRKPSEQESA